MSNPSSVADHQHVSGPLVNTYPTYREMTNNNIIFTYRGIVTSDLVTHVLEIMEEKLEEDQQSRKLSKKVYNVMVECLTNIYSDEEAPADPEFDPTAILLVRRDDETYSVSTGHYIENATVHGLKNMLDKINAMDLEGLKELYQEVLRTEDPAATGLTNLAIIDLARKSKHKLNYEFKYISRNYTFFTLESRISRDSL